MEERKTKTNMEYWRDLLREASTTTKNNSGIFKAVKQINNPAK